MDEIVGEFLVESYENLDQLDRDLVTLESDPTNRDTLASIFRTIHTIKGTCGFLGFSKLEAVAHVGENLLSRLRDGLLTVDPEITSALLATVDAVRRMLGAIEATEAEGDGDYSALVADLARLAEPRAAVAAAPATKPRARRRRAATPDGGGGAGAKAKPGAVSVVKTHGPPRLGEILVSEGAISADDLTLASQEQALGDPRRIGEILVDHGSAVPKEVHEALAAQTEHRGGGSGAVADASIRVDVGLLDKLMNLVGELVLARNQIMQLTTTREDTSLVGPSQRLNLITTELQEGVMKTRMQPIGNVWNKFPRVVRDLALACGKQVRLDLEGADTELDKTIIEAIKDPLTHLVRNSVDHGVEAPEARTAAGKAATGRLLLRAFHEGGQVNIEIVDDGGGIDGAKVRAKAVERGLVTREQAERMSEREAQGLIFLPGFSTADKVSNISGRGVGMDVVKTNIEKIGGSVDVSSQPGAGTTFRIKIPLTLAIIPALIATVAGDRYAIPQVSLLELVRLDGDQVRTGIEMIHGVPVYRLRGNLLPLVYLRHELGIAPASAEPGEAVNIVVLQADGRPFGLVVEGISDSAEIVVKPLARQLKSVSAFSGATIMGDGRVALILDVAGVAHGAGVAGAGRETGLAETDDLDASKVVDERHALLLVGMGADGRLAIPLSSIARLEEFARTAVEWAGSQEVVQYRGHILPLVRLSSVVGSAGYDDDPGGLLQVVVYSDGDRQAGLVVDRILDAVETLLDLEGGADGRHVLGTAVIQERVTDVLDVEAVACMVDPRFCEPANAGARDGREG